MCLLDVIERKKERSRSRNKKKSLKATSIETAIVARQRVMTQERKRIRT